VGSTSRKGKAVINPSAPAALGICDRCGDLHNLRNLRFQFDWAGPTMINKQVRVCPRCYDRPQEQLRTVILPPDPMPVRDARLELFDIDERNEYTLRAIIGKLHMFQAFGVLGAELTQLATGELLAALAGVGDVTAALQRGLGLLAALEGVASITTELTLTPAGGGGLDTALKRRMAAGVTYLPIRGPIVTPDAAKGAIWRAMVAASYSFGIITTPPEEGTLITAAQRRSAAGLTYLPILGPTVTPDGTKPALWRAQVAAGYYAGESTGGGTPAETLFAGASMDANFVAGTAHLFGTPIALSSLLTCSRALAAYYTSAAGVMTLVAPNTLRYGDRGLLVEPEVTNLALQSEDFSAAVWSKSNATVTANATADPVGGSVADRLVETAASGNHRVTQSLGVKAAGRFVLSVFAKAGERTQLDLAISVGSNFIGNIFQLSGSGSVVRNDDGGSQINRRRRGIEALGGGWYRCWIAGQTTASLSHSVVIGAANGGSNSYAVNTSSGLFLWGAQYETAEWLDGPTSYIPTGAATVTRPDEIVEFPDLSWIDGAQDTLFVEWLARRAEGATVLAVNATNDKALTQDMVMRPTVAGASTSNGGYAERAVTKAAMRLAANDVRLTCNGGSIATDTSESAPGAVTAVRLGLDLSGNNGVAGHIRRVAGWKGAAALSNADMQTVAAQSGPPGIIDPATLQEQEYARATSLMIHWNMATFSTPGGEQWAEGDEPLSQFDVVGAPTALQVADNWLDAAALIGASYICPTSMHHDGTPLWNSAVAPRHLGLTPWGAAGNSEFFQVLYDRAKARGFEVIPYFSIWNRKFELDNPSFDNAAGRRAYTQLVKDLLTELHARCPDIKGLWTDGWLWRVGYVVVSWQDIREHIASLWPNAILIENSHEGGIYRYEHSDVETFEDGGSAPLPAGNTAYAQNNITMYVTPSSPARHWFYNSNNVQTPGSGESNGTSTPGTSAQMITARTFSRNNHAQFQLNVGADVTGFIRSAEIAVLTAMGTG